MRTALPFAYASVAALVLACSDSTGPSSNLPAPPGDPGGSFQVAPATATLQYGQTLQFTTTYGGKRGTGSAAVAVAWQSSDESVAVVRNGLVRGVSGGKTRIVATWGGYQSTAVVNVIAPWKKHENLPVCVMRAPSAGPKLTTQC
jgi:Bacterial Ig-like domain (group 2)